MSVESRDHGANIRLHWRPNINLRDPSSAVAILPPCLNSLTNHHRSCMLATTVVYNDNIIVIGWERCWGGRGGWQRKKKTLKKASPHPRHQTRDENDKVEIDCGEGEKFNFAFLSLSPRTASHHPWGVRMGYPVRRENQLVCSHGVSDLCKYACNFLRILPRYPRQPKGPTFLQLYIYLGIIISFKPTRFPGLVNCCQLLSLTFQLNSLYRHEQVQVAADEDFLSAIRFCRSRSPSLSVATNSSSLYSL